MREWFVTFGSQYPRVPHPTFERAHRDGWVTVVAPDERDARRLTVELLGTAWSGIYEEQPESWLFPLGELHRIEAAS